MVFKGVDYMWAYVLVSAAGVSFLFQQAVNSNLRTRDRFALVRRVRELCRRYTGHAGHGHSLTGAAALG